MLIDLVGDGRPVGRPRGGGVALVSLWCRFWGVWRHAEKPMLERFQCISVGSVAFYNLLRTRKFYYIENLFNLYIYNNSQKATLATPTGRKGSSMRVSGWRLYALKRHLSDTYPTPRHKKGDTMAASGGSSNWSRFSITR